MKSIIFNQHQVNHALKNKEGMFRVACKKQPKEHPNYVRSESITAKGYYFPFGKWKFEVGETIFVKEKFNIFCGQVAYETTITGNERYFWMSANRMKQEHSRLTLRIKSVKVEMLQDISKEDCLKEGVFWDIENHFAGFWDSTHKKPEEKWEANPFCFVYEYEVVR